MSKEFWAKVLKVVARIIEMIVAVLVGGEISTFIF